MKSPGSASMLSSSRSPKRNVMRPAVRQTTLSQSPWWCAPDRAPGARVTRPTQRLRDPTVSAATAASRRIPGVCDVCGDSSPARTTLSSATLSLLDRRAVDPQQYAVRLLDLLEGEVGAADRLLVHEQRHLAPQRLGVAAEEELVARGRLPLLGEAGEQPARGRAPA